MIEKMDRFTTLGFRPIGEWKLAGLNLVCELVEKDPRGNFIYAFVMGQAIMFLEYSRTPLEARMDAYRHTDHRYAGTFQPMNKRLREKSPRRAGGWGSGGDLGFLPGGDGI